MNRKDFLKASCGFCALSGASFMMGAGGVSAQESQEGSAESNPERDLFIKRWLKDMLANMECALGREKAAEVMVENGRDCAREVMLHEPGISRGDLDGFLELFRTWMGDENVTREGSEIILVWEKCLCPLVMGIEGELPELYCECSRGWFLEVFSAVCEKEVDVELPETLLRGGRVCRAVVTV